jgi:hypothetical protein
MREQPVTFFSKARSSFIIATRFCLFFFVIAGFSSEVLPSSPHPLSPTVLPSKSYSETYKLSALYNDQTFVQVQMMITNVGLGDSNAACELLVLRPGEKPSKTCRRFKKTSWNFSTVLCPTLSIGPCRLWQEGESTRCLIAFDSIVATISFENPSGPDQAPDTIVADKAMRKFYVNEVVVPWTGLSTALRMPGFVEKQLKGFGMLEHSRSVGYPKDFSSGWISFYGNRPGGQFLAEAHFPANKASGATGWTWNGWGQTSKPLSGLQMVMKASNDGSRTTVLPSVTALHSSLVISGEQSLFRYSIVDELGPLLGNVVRLIIGNPVTRYYRAQAQVSQDQEAIGGVLEIMNFE